MIRWIAGAACAALAGIAFGQAAPKLVIKQDWGTVEAYRVAPDVIRVDTHPNGVPPVPTEMMDPKGLRTARPLGTVGDMEASRSSFTAGLTKRGLTLMRGPESLTIDVVALKDGLLRVAHANGDNLYGMRGNGLFRVRDPRLLLSAGLLRNSGAPVAAGSQGDGGAPLAYTNHWGMLVDSIDGEFKNENGVLEFGHGSRKDIEAYFIVGEPKRTMAVVAALTGHPPMPPKWAMGFMNSQWGTDEKMVLGIVDKYRSEQIPLDAFIFDFDFKAWGEDNYGEFRWNSTNAPGNVGGDKYPDGQNGEFGKQMLAKGVHLVGIMKPRILTQNVDLKPTMAAAEATAHNWWMPKKPYQDYFSHRLANDLDFGKPDLRKWYWQHAKNLFDTGLAGWWNDEADDGFDSLGFFHMQESLFEGQESVSNRRVWSINRNFYLGAQRFAFGTWSGDIRTGFANMAAQRTRMLLLTDLGQSQWSMDTGGFNGHPNPENYARWMEFAAMVPIMRVHGTYGQRRQPWEYGPVAEAAAKKAIDWRYKMFPSLYSWEREANQTGIGIVRPMFWEFPSDPQCANVVDEWMLGNELLVSPIVEAGQTTKSIYLPPGEWYDMATDRNYSGGKTISIDCDSQAWSDMPMFVRGGSILATQPVEQFSGQEKIDEITLDFWPAGVHMAQFFVYDDDGETRSYRRGAFFRQEALAGSLPDGVEVDLMRPTGPYRTPIHRYKVRIHGHMASKATWNGRATPISVDGGVAEVELPAGTQGRLVLH